MKLEVTRIYKNSATDIIRVDTIYMQPTTNQLTSGVNARTFYRDLSTSKLHEPADRVVASIQLITSADTVETATGNYLTATWTGRNAGVPILCDMSDLPRVGNTV